MILTHLNFKKSYRRHSDCMLALNRLQTVDLKVAGVLVAWVCAHGFPKGSFETKT